MSDHQIISENKSETILSNAQLILENEIRHGHIRIQNGIITDIGEGNSHNSIAINCNGQYLSPGLIELHTDNLERHLQPRPGVKWPMEAAILSHDSELVSVGITTVFDALRAGSVISNHRSAYKKYARDGANQIIKLRPMLKASHHIHLRCEICSETLIEELDEFSINDHIGVVSLMDHTPGQRQFRDLDQMRTYLQGKYNMSDDEIYIHFDLLRELQSKNKAKHTQATLAFSKRIGAHVASHDDTTVDEVNESRELGVRFAEFPTTLEAAKQCTLQDIYVMMGAPNLLRGHSHSGNVAAQTLVDLDLLDILSSDYSPSALLMAALKLGDLLGDIPKAMKAVTSTPARVTGLDDRGKIAIGMRADLITFHNQLSYPQVTTTWVNGNRVA